MTSTLRAVPAGTALGAKALLADRSDRGQAGSMTTPDPILHNGRLAACRHMPTVLRDAGFNLVETPDSTEESHRWFAAMAARLAKAAPAVTFQAFLGNDLPATAQNQVRNLRDGRIRTLSHVCEA